MRGSEVTVEVFISRPIPSYRGEQSVKPAIDRRKVSAESDGIAPLQGGTSQLGNRR